VISIFFAIAVDKSIQWGYTGVLYGFAQNRELVNHYVQTFGAVYLGRLHEYQIAVFEQEAGKLLLQGDDNIIRGANE